jgi:hypothetical protein
LAQEEYTNYPVFLVGLPFDADRLVDGLRDTSCFFLATKAYCFRLGRFIWGRAESSSEGVFVISGGAHETGYVGEKMEDRKGTRRRREAGRYEEKS